MKIIVDQRERNGILDLLKKDAEVETASLKVGDFILSNDVCVERKTIRDFVSSLIDKRLFNQATELKNNFSKPLFILEGDIDMLFEISDVKPNAIKAALASLLLNYQIPILFTKDIDETASYLKIIAKREQTNKNNNVSIRGSKKLYTSNEMQQYLVEGLPNIGPALAKNLLSTFKTPKHIFNADQNQLIKVEKIGKKKAETINKILNSEYCY